MRATIIFRCCLLVSPANAQVQSGSYWPLLNPDVWLQRLLQFAIVSARTQVDVKFQNLTTNVAAGTVSLSGVELWPLPEWDNDYKCRITVARLSISGIPIEEVEMLSLTASAFGVEIDPSCLPPDLGPTGAVLGAAGIESLSVSKIRADFKYDVPAGSLLVDAIIGIQDMLSLAASIDLSYFTVDMRTSVDPHPVVFLRDARIEFEDQGLWSMLKPILPLEIKDPAKIKSQVVPQLAREILAASDDGSELSEAQQTFVDSVSVSLSDFVVDPGRLVVELRPKGEVALSPSDLEDVHYLFENLAPKMVRRSVVMGKTVPTPLLRSVIAGKYQELSVNELSKVAQALVTGVGAPRNLETGRLLALELADRGAVSSALAAAKLLQGRDPVKAYELAVSAAGAGSFEAAGLADRIENRLSLVAVLQAQRNLSEELSEELEITDVHKMGDRAFSRVAGTQAVRNYERAAFWAILATAAGDPDGRAVLDEIDAMVDVRTEEDQDTWAASMRRIETEASEVWLQQDMPELINEKE